MRSILSIVFGYGCGVLVGCGGSNEPAKEPSGMTTPHTTANAPTNQASPMGATPETASTTPPPPGGPSVLGPPASTQGMPSTAPTPAMISDAEIVAITSAANSGEIEEAKAALKGAQNAQVKSFANMMIKEHGEAETKGKKVAQTAKITPAESEISKKLKSDTESRVASLRSQKGAEVDRSYMDAQIKAHRDVLATIDDKLLPNAKNADLKAHLGEVRHHVSMHLDKAQEISASLGGTASTSTKR